MIPARKDENTSPDNSSGQQIAATKSLVRHGFVYGLGQIALRLASIALLPVYTRYLTPADYGVIALVDITIGLLGMAVGGQAASAATRQHFSERWGQQRGRVWWNGLWFVGVSDLVVLGPAIVCLGPLTSLVFGPTVARGELWLLMGLLTLALTSLEQMGLAYLRVEKRSTTIVAISFGRFFLNIAVNLTLLNVLESGITAILLGNLMVALVAVLLTIGMSIWRLPFAAADRALFETMWKFSGPLWITTLSSWVMHETGRFTLRLFADLSDVGVYGLAQQIGQGVNGLLIMPLSMIYSTIMMEVAGKPYAHWFYATVFRVFAGMLGLCMLAIAVLAPEIFSVLIGPNFQDAARLVPLTCLAYFLFSLHTHFSIPVWVAEKTSKMIPASVMGAVTVIAANLILVPLLGAVGAGIASILAFATYSFGGHLLYRRVDKIDFAFGELALLMGGGVLTFFLCAAWRDVAPSHWGFLIPALSCIAWAAFLCWRHKWLNLVALLTNRLDQSKQTSSS
ncbi:MAG: lipopolysaccharide biosynthesis protein [Steroidobacteraceae bacterium]